jgi:hypothetical protein
MARAFDSPPVNDQFVDKDGYLTPLWRDWFATQYQTLITYLTPSGVILPPNTTAQRDKIITPQNGSMIQNITTGEPDIYLGSWKEIQHT